MKVWLLWLLVVVMGGHGVIEAQRPDAPSYGKRGDFAVGTREYIIEDAVRPLMATVWYPASDDTDANATTRYTLHALIGVAGRAVSEADWADVRSPLVVFSHGSGGSRVLALWLTEHLASHGFVVVAIDHPQNNVAATLSGGQDFPLSYALRPLDVLRAIDWARSEADFRDMVDGDRVAVIGHSFGGYTALSVGGARLDMDKLQAWCDAQNDPEQALALTIGVCFLENAGQQIAEYRGYDDVPTGAWDATVTEGVRAVVALAPWNAPIMNQEANETPTLFIVGDSDRVTPAERDTFVMFDEMRHADRWLVTFELADHYIFVDTCAPSLLAFGAFGSCSDGVWDMQRAHDLSNHYIVAFLRHYLYDNDEAISVFDERMPRGLWLEHQEAVSP